MNVVPEPDDRREPRPPVHMWREPVIRQLLAVHDFGAVFTAVNLRGTSQRLIGQWVGMSQPDVSAIMHGRKVLAYKVIAKIAYGLQIPPGLLGVAWCDHPEHPPSVSLALDAG